MPEIFERFLAPKNVSTVFVTCDLKPVVCQESGDLRDVSENLDRFSFWQSGTGALQLRERLSLTIILPQKTK